MRKHFGLSAIALLSALGLAVPAQAQLLNLGGGGDSGLSVNVGGQNGATVTVGGDSAVSVDAGNSSGGGDGSILGGAGIDPGGLSSGNLIDIDGDGDDDDALIDLDFGGGDETPVGNAGGSNGLIDLGGDADGDALINLFGDGNVVGDGGLDIELGDDGDLIDIGSLDGDLIDLGGLLGDGVGDEGALLDLFGPGGDLLGGEDVVVDLSGERSDPNDVTVNLDDDAAAVVDLFGGDTTNVKILGDGTPDVTANAGGEDGHTVNVDILGDLLADANETGGGGDDGPGNGGGDDDGPAGGNDDDEQPGNGNSDGGGGGDVADGDGNGGLMPGYGNGGVTVPAVRVAAANTDANQRCFTPSEEQIAYLLANRNYDMSMSASWASGEIDLVPVRLCPEARAKLAAAVEGDAEIQWLQDAVWADARIHAELMRVGLASDNVLALDTKDGDVNVYVF